MHTENDTLKEIVNKKLTTTKGEGARPLLNNCGFLSSTKGIQKVNLIKIKEWKVSAPLIINLSNGVI